MQSLIIDGFSLSEEDRPAGVAFLSLKIALQSYFSTYEAMKSRLHMFDGSVELDQNTIDWNHTSAYATAYTETIVHFQHFVELICKDILRAKHPLLALDARRHTVLQDMLLSGEQVEQSDLDNLQTPEFSVSLARTCDLISAGRLGDPGELDFLVEQREFLEKLNTLRNRIWHRGTFVLRLPALDRFVGSYCLPLVKAVANLPRFTGMNRIWKYQPLDCNIDPIDAIEDEFNAGRYEIGKISILKGLGRAAYSNPLIPPGFGDILNVDHRVRAEKVAASESPGLTIHTCPVCATKSLVAYEESDVDDYDEKEGGYALLSEYVWQVKCHCCTFSIDSQVGNPGIKHGLPLDNYWRHRENRGEWVLEV